jgi:pyruvate formate lyase activating enzyme
VPQPRDPLHVPVTLTYPKANKTVTYGRLMTVEEIVTEIMEDADFYRESSGGVTISGGEPLLQYEAVADLAEALQKRGISVILDTAGCVAWGRFEVVLPFVDTVFFDWKTSDPTFMSERIRGSLPLIRQNLTNLLQSGKDVHIRIPLIPAVNTSEEALIAIAADLREAGARTVALLPFHRLAAGKYEAMGLDYPYRDTPPLPAEEVSRAAAYLSEFFTVYTEK